jgi:hypothetical protein
MPQTIHVIPTGFDRHRLISPFIKGDLEADKVILIYNKDDENENTDEVMEKHREEVEFVNETTRRLKSDFESYADIPEVEVEDMGGSEEIYHYDKVYTRAYDFLDEQLEQGHEVWVNISSMPRTVAFGFSTAATTLVSDKPDLQDRLHTYYVAPQDYFGPRMKEQLNDTSDFLTHLLYEFDSLLDSVSAEDIDNSEIVSEIREMKTEIEGHHNSVQSVCSDLEQYGLTKGAMEINEQRYIDFPHFRHPDITGGEIAVLYTIKNIGEANSISELADNLSDVLERGDKDSLKSMAQYNIGKLVHKGFVERKQNGGRGYNYRLSKMGSLWSEKHDMETELQEYKERSKD